jgi:hypothetical protein
MNAYRRFIVIFAAAALLTLLTLAAACTGQPVSDLVSATATPQPQPTLDLHQPSPTPEILPPPGSQDRDISNVQPLITMPRAMALKDPSGSTLAAEFYPAPQPGKAVLLLVPDSAKELAAWRLFAQTAQVKGLAALGVSRRIPVHPFGAGVAGGARKRCLRPDRCSRFRPGHEPGPGYD